MIFKHVSLYTELRGIDMEDNTKNSSKLLHCSFCGKNQNEVPKLIAGPSVFICDECVDLCNEIISDELEEKSSKSNEKLPKPHEINPMLKKFYQLRFTITIKN